MSLQDQISTRTEDVVEQEAKEGGGSYEKISLGGPYLAKVIDAWDSKVVFPEGDGTRFINVQARALKAIRNKRIGETEEELRERREEEGKIVSGRCYMSKKTVNNALGILGGIAGDLEFSQTFDDQAKVRKDGEVVLKDGEPVYDLEYVANEIPINPGNLVGRKFIMMVEYDDYNDMYAINLLFQSVALDDEEVQEEPPVNLLEGEDEVSEKVKSRINPEGNAGSGQSSDRAELLEDDQDGELVTEDDEDDGLPF